MENIFGEVILNFCCINHDYALEIIHDYNFFCIRYISGLLENDPKMYYIISCVNISVTHFLVSLLLVIFLTWLSILKSTMMYKMRRMYNGVWFIIVVNFLQIKWFYSSFYYNNNQATHHQLQVQVKVFDVNECKVIKFN